jgi:hypothetical protein
LQLELDLSLRLKINLPERCLRKELKGMSFFWPLREQVFPGKKGKKKSVLFFSMR